MSDFQTVKNAKRKPNSGVQQLPKYSEQYHKLIEMGFESKAVNRALEEAKGDLEAATIFLLENASAPAKNGESEEKVVESKPTKQQTQQAQQSQFKTNTKGGKDLKEVHHKMMATYKMSKCKEGPSHDRKMCTYWHSLSDRRRNPFEYTYSCFECPAIAAGNECKDGDSCPHSHTMLERMFHPELYKISICTRTQNGQKCDRGVLCAFAHTDADLRVVQSTSTPKPPVAVELKPPAKPLPESENLTLIVERLSELIKEVGPEGIIGTDLARKYQAQHNEPLELVDEQGEKHKIRDVLALNPNIGVIFTKSSPPKYVFDESRTKAAAVASEKPAEPVKTVDVATVKDRLVQLVKVSGSDGVSVSDISKKYNDQFEKLDNSLDLSELLNELPGVETVSSKGQSKYVHESNKVVVAAPAAAPAPKSSGLSYSLVTGKSYLSAAAAPKPQPPAPVVETKAPVAEAPKKSKKEERAAKEKEAAPAPAPVIVEKEADTTSPTTEDLISEEQAKEVANQVVEEVEEVKPVVSEPAVIQSAFSYATQPETKVIEEIVRKPEPLMGAPGLTKMHSQTPSLAVESSLIFGSLNAPSTVPIASTSSVSEFAERLSAAQAQCASLQQQINVLQNELAVKTNESEGQSHQLRTMMQRLAEAESKTNSSDEQYKQQIKSKTDELAQKSREVKNAEEELRKTKDERKNDLNQLFVSLSQIEDAINIMKCKEEVYSDKIRPDDVQELLQFRKALKGFLLGLKGQIKQKFETITVAKTLEIEADLSVQNFGLNTASLQSTQRYVAPAAGYESMYYPNVGRVDPYTPYAYEPGQCALPGCRNPGHFTCAGCQKASYCGADHQRLHWATHSMHCHQ